MTHDPPVKLRELLFVWDHDDGELTVSVHELVEGKPDPVWYAKLFGVDESIEEILANEIRTGAFREWTTDE